MVPEPLIPAAKRSRDGAVEGYFDRQTKRSIRAAALLDFPLGEFVQLDVVKARITSPTKREVVGSIPPWPILFDGKTFARSTGGPVAQW